MKTKFARLNERLDELKKLNGDLGRLAFYINEQENPNTELKEQLLIMKDYSDILLRRIIEGNY